MKANDAPEKIYLIRNLSTPTALNTTNDCHDKYLQEWYKGREKDTDIEYTRTDAFIEKACEFWDKNQRGFVTYKDIVDFKNYMKGEYKAW